MKVLGFVALALLAAVAAVVVATWRLPSVFDDATRWDGNRGSPRSAPG